jgi:hypothetical protein
LKKEKKMADVNVIEIFELDDMAFREYMQGALEDFRETGTCPQFIFSATVFESISPATVVHALSSFLALFLECRRLYFKLPLSKQLSGFLRHILQDFNCSETASNLIFFSAAPVVVGDSFEDMFLRIEDRIVMCRKNRERTLSKKSVKPNVIGVSLDQLREDDELMEYSRALGAPPADFLAEFERDLHKSVCYAEENDILAWYLDEIPLDESRYLRYIGAVTAQRLRDARAHLGRGCPLAAVVSVADLKQVVEYADTNRQAVGLGHLEMAPIAATLLEMGYAGYVSAEVLPLPDAATASARTLESFRRWFPR